MVWVRQGILIGDPGMCYPLCPRPLQKRRQLGRQFLQLRAKANLGCHFLSEQVALLRQLQGGHGSLTSDLAGSVLLVQPGDESVKHLLERLFIAGRGLNERAQRALQAAKKTFEAGRFDRFKRQTSMRDLVEQAPCRVVAITEEARIAQSQSQQGWFHAADQLLYRCQQAFVAGDVVDHQGHHF